MTTQSETPRTDYVFHQMDFPAPQNLVDHARQLEREVTALTAANAVLTAQLAEARRDAEKMRKRHESSHAEVLRLADELRKRDPTWGSPMRLNNAAIQESKK